jgi:hypothetical protein
VDNPLVSINDLGAPWKNLAESAGVFFPETYYFKPPGRRIVTLLIIQRTCKQDKGIINIVCEEEKELSRKDADTRLD